MEKYLLVLGASPFTVPLIKLAKANGFITISCSNIPSDPGLRESDFSENISILNRSALEVLVKKYNPVGIVTAASDLATLSIGYLNSKFGFSGILENQVLSVTDKGEFIKLQDIEKLPMPTSISIESIEPPSLEEIGSINFPMIMKPFFSSGSRGVMKVKNYDELSKHHKSCIEASSGRKGYILQSFLEDYTEVGCEVLVENGEIIFIETTHKFLNQRQVPTGHCVPGPLAGEELNDLKHQVSKICKSLKVINSPINLDVLTRKGKRPVIIDMSFRLGGNLLPEIMHYKYNTNPYKRIIKYASDSNFEDLKILKRNDQYIGSLIFGSNVKQEFSLDLKKSITALLKNNALELVFDFEIGSEIEEFIQGNKRFGHALVKVSSFSDYVSLHKELDTLINRV